MCIHLALFTYTNTTKNFVQMGEIDAQNRVDDVSRDDRTAITCERLNKSEKQLNRLQKITVTKAACSISHAYITASIQINVSHASNL